MTAAKRSQEKELVLGRVSIWMPSAGDSTFSVFEDLAKLFAMEFSDDAVDHLRKAWRDSGHRGRLSIDPESDFVAITAGRDAIVDLAVLINRLVVGGQFRKLDEAEIARVRAAVKAYKRPPRIRWMIGDVFAVPLSDGTFAYGQVLWEQDFGENSRARAPTCALFDRRPGAPEVNPAEVVASNAVAILHVDSSHLSSGEWRVIGNCKPSLDPFAGPCGKPNTPGCQSWDGLEVLAGAWHGLAPWNCYFADNYLDRFLLPGNSRPANAIMLGREELERLGVRRRDWL